jgi:GDP-4-dehydro-6-deoxy-D-mannose reductase
MRALITGANGFVGKHLDSELKSGGYETVCSDICGDGYERMNILDKSSISDMLAKHRPDVIFHLAGQSSVGRSWQIPQTTFEINVCGTMNLLETVHTLGMSPRLIIIGSADQYGIVKPSDCPIKETLVQNPKSPYAISKAAQESVSLSLAGYYGLEVVMTRSFNHIGPGQRTGFVVPDFANAIAAIEKKGMSGTLRVGNLEAMRDFTDVRDVVRAYRLLAEKGRPGEVYNIGSGAPVKIAEILSALVGMSGAKITVERDPAKMRASDLPIVSCCYDKIKSDTGWEPRYSLKQTLEDTLDYFRSIQ